jgi:hypothetical protein
MGANAVTTVPVYTAGEVLTAADMNITNSGIPVFATTVTRDAAFGGTGEKTLAEGQFAYIEATDQTMYYSGASWLALGGKLGQVVSTTKTDTYTMSSQTYTTVTGLTATITPSSATSKIYIVGSLSGIGDSGVTRGMARLVRDSTGIAVGDTAGSRVSGTVQLPIFSATADVLSQTLTFLDSPASTSALVYGIQIRINDSGATIYVNRSKADGNTVSDARVVSTITVMEILA